MFNGQFFEQKGAMRAGDFRPRVSAFAISTLAIIRGRFV
jgi:hypothetical protein